MFKVFARGPFSITRYFPSGRHPLNKRKVEKLLTKMRLSDAVYKRYRRHTERYLADFAEPARGASPRRVITALQMHNSLLFEREYLVAYVRSEWFHKTSPGHDAVATEYFQVGATISPPLVLVPENKKNTREQGFRSVLEHEFVHVNQILLGTFPRPLNGSTKDLTEEIYRMTRAEYEANLLQLVRWPQLYSRAGKQTGLSLESWCVFRGYTQGLEQIILATAKGDPDENKLLRFLYRLPAVLPVGFRRMGFSEFLGKSCAKTATLHTLTAFHLLAERLPALRDSLQRLKRKFISKQM